MGQQLMTPTPSHPARQQLQVVLVELAEIERRLRDVNLVVARIAAELTTSSTAEIAGVTSENEVSVRAALVKPRSPSVIRTLVQANQRAEPLATLSPTELQALLGQSREQAQAEANARGEAIDDEREAALGD